MADDTLQINLVTPERVLLDGAATEVLLRTAAGDLAFLPGHTPLVGTVEPGVVRVVRPEGDEVRVAVHGGFVQVEHRTGPDDGGTNPGAPTAPAASAAGTWVTILVGVAELAEEIDADRARAALETAEARLAELGGPTGAGGRPTAGGGAPVEGEAADPALVEAEAALSRAQVRLEALDAGAGATSPAPSH
jgi:F-type H+-transporting ATPase subunit epsilon